MTKTADITQVAPQQIVEQIASLQPEEELLIVNKSVPLARVTPVKLRKKKLPFGCGRETNKILGPIDEPLVPESDWNMLTGESFP
jgi:hypothetical protein